MKTKKFRAIVIVSIVLTFGIASLSNAWDETQLPADLGNYTGIGSSGFQFTTGDNFVTEDGWNTHVAQSGQDLLAHIDLPANIGEYQSTNEEMTINAEISNWQEYNSDISLSNGTAYQMGTEAGTISISQRPISGQETLAIASLNTTTTQSMEFNDNPTNDWGTNRAMMSQKFKINTRDYNPGSEISSVNYDARLEQGYDRIYTENGLTVHQGGWQTNSVNINSTPGTTETTVIEH